MSEDLRVTNDDFPGLFRVADSASVAAQKRYSCLTIIHLTLLVIAAALGSFAALVATPQKGNMAIASAIVLGISIIITWVIRTGRLEQTWYDGRAIAESVKSLAWRYMTCSEPYIRHLEAKEVDQKFMSDLSAILAERRNLSAQLGGQNATKPQLTKRMRDIRSLETEDRKKVYLSDRIDDQRRWYGTKAERNRKLASRLFAAIISWEALALSSAIVLVRWLDSPVNLVGIFVILAAAFLAWLQHKRHQGLAQSYGLATQELGLVSEQSTYVATEEELSHFVSDSENAISREHTLWRARRDQRYGI